MLGASMNPGNPIRAQAQASRILRQSSLVCDFPDLERPRVYDAGEDRNHDDRGTIAHRLGRRGVHWTGEEAASRHQCLTPRNSCKV